MKLRTVIIDDEPIALEKLRSYVGKIPFLELVASHSGAVEAAATLAAEPVDLIFTDISMPDLDGMEFIRALASPPMVVFTTAHAGYAAESYRLSAVDYLLKPYSLADFTRAANKALEVAVSRNRAAAAPTPSGADDSLFVKVDSRYLRVRLADIRYIKGYGEYLQIFVDGHPNPLVTLSSFAAIRDRLTPDFLQIHRSYLVNMNRVDRIERSRVVMDPDTWLPVGDSYKADLQAYLARCAVGMKRESGSLNR